MFAENDVNARAATFSPRYPRSKMEPFDEETPPHVRETMYERLRAMTPAQRLARMVALNRSVESLARTGIKQRHPNADEREVRVRLARMWLDHATILRVVGWLPQDP